MIARPIIDFDKLHQLRGSQDYRCGICGRHEADDIQDCFTPVYDPKTGEAIFLVCKNCRPSIERCYDDSELRDLAIKGLKQAIKHLKKYVKAKAD